MNIGEAVINLLNRLEMDPQSVEFMASMKPYELIVHRNESFRTPGSSLNTYYITKMGLTLYSNDGRFDTVDFNLKERTRNDGIRMVPFAGALHFALPPHCCRADVRSIFGEPLRTNTAKNN